MCVCVCRDRRAVERYSVTSRRKSYILDAGRSVPFFDHHPYLSSRVTAAILPIVASLIIDRSDSRFFVTFVHIFSFFFFFLSFFHLELHTYIEVRGTIESAPKSTFTHTQRKKEK